MRWTLSLVPLLCVACGSGNLASAVAEPPAFDPGSQQSTSQIRKTPLEPLIVEWPSADRAELEGAAKRGVVVVDYDGKSMRVLSHCTVRGSCEFMPVTAKEETVRIHNEDELWTNLPIGAVNLSAKLASSGELNVVMTVVGRYRSAKPDFGPRDLEGECTDASHVVVGLTVGAFEFFAGAGAKVGGSVQVLEAGGGGESKHRRETLSRDGDSAACKKDADGGPPKGCQALPLKTASTPRS